jgi:hypothetical protein
MGYQEESPYRKPFLDAFSMYERARLWGNSIVEDKLHEVERHPDIGCIACPPPKASRDQEDVAKTGIDWQMFACFDGNYGLKRMNSVRGIDTLLKRPKEFFVLDDDFDSFNAKHERTRPGQKATRGECSDHFKAAQDSSKVKKQVDITGVFAMTCARHGWAYRGLNFRGTGERMVYALQILDWLIDKWGAKGIRTLYDINCIFKKYVEVSVEDYVECSQNAYGLTFVSFRIELGPG